MNPSFSDRNPYDVKTSRGAHEGYFSIDAPERSVSVLIDPPRISICSRSHDDADHDGIRLTYGLQQTPASPPSHDRPWAAV